jgi:tetratricopeptide (TPR) repeat protein
MKLTSHVTAPKNPWSRPALSERAELACRTARQFEKSGDYEEARAVLEEFWPQGSQFPELEGLATEMHAEVLLRAGSLSGWLGSTNPGSESQETAKNLITRAVDLFEGLGQTTRAAEARGDLALCYWREGGYDEARIHLATAVSSVGDADADLKASLLIRSGIIEVWAQRPNEALRFYADAYPLLEQSDDHYLKGAFHNEYGLLFRRMAAPENREDYLDRALLEYAAASFHFEQAGNRRYLARVENNLGYLFFTIGRYKEAYEHLDRARSLFIELGDPGTAAQVNDTRARTLLAEGYLKEAERYARSAVKTLERGDQQAVLAEALTTYGTVLARLGNHSRARTLLERASEIAEAAGDWGGAARAQLSMIEELADQTSRSQLVATYRSAAEFLAGPADPAANKRLISCAHKIIEALVAAGQEAAAERESNSWEGFSFKREVRRLEKGLIERALRDAGGSVSKAARLLGFKHHQSLIAIINSRHADLQEKRSAVRKRRKHLFSKPKRAKKAAHGALD